MEWEGLLTFNDKVFTSTIRWRLLIPLSENIRKLMTQERKELIDIVAVAFKY